MTIKHKHLIFNTFQLMKRCPICNKDMGNVYVTTAPNLHLYKLERACYSCTCIVHYVFELEELVEISFIVDDLKLEIFPKRSKTFLFKRDIRYLTAWNEYVEINWKKMLECDEEFDFDILNLKEVKLKMETLVLFS